MQLFYSKYENTDMSATRQAWHEDSARFEIWAEHKLSCYEEAMRNSVVEIKDPTNLTLSERSALLQRLRKLNLVIYDCRSRDFTKNELKTLGSQLGLNRLDKNLLADSESISSVHIAESGAKTHYIPYTNKPLGWHTDGYYNHTDRMIRSFILHCVNPAVHGGANTFLDPEIIYLLLRRRNAEYAASLSRGDAFSVPANASESAELRPAYTGPVFSRDPINSCLHMRYTNRSRNISWNSAPAIVQAVAYLRLIIDQAADFTIAHKLESGQGVICNNVMHKRSDFKNGKAVEEQRFMYRARYYDRVLST